MKDLSPVVNATYQVKELLKLYSPWKYSVLVKWRLRLEIWNVSLNILSEALYSAKRWVRKKLATEHIVLPSFINDSDAEGRTTVRRVNGNRGKGVKTLPWKCSLQEICSLTNFAQYFRIYFIVLINFFNTKSVTRLRNQPTSQTQGSVNPCKRWLE